MAQQPARLDSRSTMHITLPEDAPVSVVSADWGESQATPKGGAMLLDLPTSLVLKNTSQRKIRGITLLVMAQEVTPGGKASVSVPSLNIAEGQTFPVRIDLTLLRPLQTGAGALVEIGLEGVLFDDLSFYGPNKLNSRRSMMVWELEARRDRQHFKQVLQGRGPEALRTEIVASLERQADRSQKDARVTAGAATATTSGQQVQFAFLPAANAPITTERGYARVIHDEALTPRIFMTNRSDRAVESVELGWLVKDSAGREFVSGSMPLEVNIGPRGKTSVVQDVALRFTQRGGRPIRISEITAFLTSVEFADGQMWVPDRSMQMPTPSPEEQRLTELYRRRGIDALVEELKKF
ncbi:MAG TPA: hypothetical protein VEQ63_04040 [Bryobacteraceae bacterium]|nr:hypothetical protein [Bryobacteraceae bacterium]